MTDDTRLREAYDELVSARSRPDRSACPAPEALLRLAEREGDERARMVTLDHVLQCAWCRPELDLLRAGMDAASTVTGSASRDARRARAFPLRALAMAAGIVAIVGVGLVARDGDDQSPGTLRGTSALMLATPERRADGALVLRWSRPSDAARYRVELFTPSGVTVAETVVTDTTYVLPATASGASGPLQWMVTAIRADGAERSSPMGRISP